MAKVAEIGRTLGAHFLIVLLKAFEPLLKWWKDSRSWFNEAVDHREWGMVLLNCIAFLFFFIFAVVWLPFGLLATLVLLPYFAIKTSLADDPCDVYAKVIVEDFWSFSFSASVLRLFGMDHAYLLKHIGLYVQECASKREWFQEYEAKLFLRYLRQLGVVPQALLVSSRDKPDGIVADAFLRRAGDPLKDEIVGLFFGTKYDMNVVLQLVQWAVAFSAENDKLFRRVWDYVKGREGQNLLDLPAFMAGYFAVREPAFMAGYFAVREDEPSPRVLKALRGMFRGHRPPYTLHGVLESMGNQNAQLGISFIDFVFDIFREDIDSSEVFDALATCVSKEQASQWFSALMEKERQSDKEKRFAAVLLRSNKILPEYLPVGLLLKLSEQSKRILLDPEVVELLHAICAGEYLTAEQLSQNNEAGQDPLEILFRACFCQRRFDEYKAITEELVKVFRAVMASEHCPPPCPDLLAWAIDHNKIEFVKRVAQKGQLTKIGIDDPDGMHKCLSVAIQKDNLAMFATLFNSLEYPNKVLALCQNDNLTVLGEIVLSDKEEFFDFLIAVQDKGRLEGLIRSSFCSYVATDIAQHKWDSRWPFRELVEHEVYGPWVLASRVGWFWDTEEGRPQKRRHDWLLHLNNCIRRELVPQDVLNELGEEIVAEAELAASREEEEKFRQGDFLLSSLAESQCDELVRLVMNLPNLTQEYLRACNVLHRSLRLARSEQSKLATVQAILNSPHWNRALMAQLDYRSGIIPIMALEAALINDRNPQPLVNAILASDHCSSELWLHPQDRMGILGYLANAQERDPESVLSVLQSPYASLAALTLSERGKTPLHEYIDFLTRPQLSVIRLILSQVYFSPTVLDLVNDEGLTPLALLQARIEAAQQADIEVSEPEQQALALLIQFSNTHSGLQADITTPAFIGAISVAVQQGWYCLVAEGLSKMQLHNADAVSYRSLLEVIHGAAYAHSDVADLVHVFSRLAGVGGALDRAICERVLDRLAAYGSRFDLLMLLLVELNRAGLSFINDEAYWAHLWERSVRFGNESLMVYCMDRAKDRSQTLVTECADRLSDWASDALWHPGTAFYRQFANRYTRAVQRASARLGAVHSNSLFGLLKIHLVAARVTEYLGPASSEHFAGDAQDDAKNAVRQDVLARYAPRPRPTEAVVRHDTSGGGGGGGGGGAASSGPELPSHGLGS